VRTNTPLPPRPRAPVHRRGCLVRRGPNIERTDQPVATVDARLAANRKAAA